MIQASLYPPAPMLDPRGLGKALDPHLELQGFWAGDQIFRGHESSSVTAFRQIAPPYHNPPPRPLHGQAHIPILCTATSYFNTVFWRVSHIG